MDKNTAKKIKIISGGPYIISGGVPLSEKIIIQKDDGNIYQEIKKYPLKNSYSLCRCGKSSKAPFCDGAHNLYDCDLTETASKAPLKTLAEVTVGKDITLYDQINLCAFARFCQDEHDDVWELAENPTKQGDTERAIKFACDCPAGRLVVLDNKTGAEIEPEYEQEITILQDPSQKCSGPLWVKGGIPIESSDGDFYEIRNRVTLCRCGNSNYKPFCDALHVKANFVDESCKNINKKLAKEE